MNDIPLGILFGALVLLILLAAFFSGSETGLLTLNRYRLRHLVKIKHRGAMHAQALLQRTDRLIGLLIERQPRADVVKLPQPQLEIPSAKA